MGECGWVGGGRGGSEVAVDGGWDAGVAGGDVLAWLRGFGWES